MIEIDLVAGPDKVYIIRGNSILFKIKWLWSGLSYAVLPTAQLPSSPVLQLLSKF
jgi:hypothetical protein